MPDSGLFVTLFDEQTLRLYLARGVYGFHMRLEQKVSRYSRHYAALADYACARRGTHIFFFLKRHIVYGGQVIGSSDHGAFYLNGPYSPLGHRAKAELVWDESKRSRYRQTTRKGIFTRPLVNKIPISQPYLLLFEDALELKGKSIVSDELYFELGEFPYPLPTNSITGMGFCTMTPAEVTKTLRLLRERPDKPFETSTDETIELSGKPLPFSPQRGISNSDQNAHILNQMRNAVSLLIEPEDARSF